MDAAIDAEIDAAIDAPPDVAVDAYVAPFAPLHVTSMLAGPPDLILATGLVTIDTSALTINGSTNPYFVRQGDYAVLFANAVSVLRPVKVTGAYALIIVAYDAVSIGAVIDLGATGRTPGPGATPAGSPGSGKNGTSFLGISTRQSSGGGGGSHGTLGAKGGSNNVGLIPPGLGGTGYGTSPADPLVGGSRGGLGGWALVGGVGNGGGGGGALQISSARSIDVLAGGQLRATGGGGATGGATYCGGGGGGAGGELLLEAPVLTIAGRLLAGGGGGGGGGGGPGPTGTDGKDGTDLATVAAGGVGGIPQGANGGAGAATVAGSLVNAVAGKGDFSKGGGGGGGGGRIWLRHRAATPPVVTSTVISPPAATDPTLP